MRRALVLSFVWLFLQLNSAGQDRASMKAPLIRTTAEELQLKAIFSDLIPGKKYRLGVGVAEGELTSVKLALKKDDQVLEKESVAFVQKHTSSWWGVNSISTQGYVLADTDLPEAGGELTLEVHISKQEADQLKQLFLLVARLYGADRWYPEDGMELKESDW